MNTNNILTEQIKNYLLEHPIDRTVPNCYRAMANKFGVDTEKIRTIYKGLRKRGLVEDIFNSKAQQVVTTKVEDYEVDYHFVNKGDRAEITKVVKVQVKNDEELLEVCDVDTNIWEIEKWECKVYQSWIKKDGNIYSEPRYSVHAFFKKRKLDNDLEKQKDSLLKEIKSYISSNKPKEKYIQPLYKRDGLLLELCLFDLHVGKLSWAEESGEDYDLKIACERYKQSIASLLSKVNISEIDRILLPIGNDMITIDSRHNMTTAGTPQDSDSRFRKMLLTVKDLLIGVIDDLSKIAQVDVVVVSGNHDYDSMFTIGMVLEAFYHNSNKVVIDNGAKQRKFYKYHNTGIMFTHGNEEKHQDLGLIFATENTPLWASTKFREVQLGHFHKNKRLNYVSVDEFQGFQIQIIPSLSGSDAWHNSKGYNSLKQAKAFLYDKVEGKVAELTHSI